MILRSIIKDGIPYALEARSVPVGFGTREQRQRTARQFLITDDVGDLYSFTHRLDAEHEWNRMFGALAQRVAA